MSEWLTRVLNESESKGMEKGIEKGMKKGIEKGIEKGQEKGTIQTLWSLVKDGLLTMDIAAARAGLSEKEFQARATALMSEEASTYEP